MAALSALSTPLWEAPDAPGHFAYAEHLLRDGVYDWRNGARLGEPVVLPPP
jgi:hypothetical protein